MNREDVVAPRALKPRLNAEGIGLPPLEAAPRRMLDTLTEFPTR